MTDNEIIKALECCIGGYGVRNCDDCPMQGKGGCIEVLPAKALDLINRQKAEIERLNSKLAAKDRVNYYNMAKLRIAREELRSAKSEVVKGFAERLKASLDWRTEPIDDYDIDELVKEMTEVE